MLALRLDSPVAFPRGWEPDTPSVAFDEQEGWMWRIKYAARTRYAMGFARAHPAMNMDRIPPTYRYALSPPGTVNAATLRLAIEDKIATYGAQYRGGPKHLAQLAELAKNDRTDGTPERAQQVQVCCFSLLRLLLRLSSFVSVSLSRVPNLFFVSVRQRHARVPPQSWSSRLQHARVPPPPRLRRVRVPPPSWVSLLHPLHIHNIHAMFLLGVQDSL